LKSANAILPVTIALAALGACSRHKPPAPPPPKVTVALPQSATVTNWDEYPGHIEAVESVEIRPRVSGYIEAIHFEDGSEVKAGDLLFEIDPKPYQATLERMQAEHQRAESRAELARNELARAENLLKTQVISEEQFDNRSKMAREAEAALASAKAAEDSAQVDLDYTRIKAPISGRIGRRLVTAGNLVQGGGMVPGTVLTTLVSADPIYCYFDADEKSLLRYRQITGHGQNPSSLACEVALAGEDGFPHKGHVDFFDNKVDPKTGTIRMRAILKNPGRILVPGMFAKARVPAGPPVETLLIPAVAIGSDQGNKFVLIVNKDSIVESRPIKADRIHGLMRAVTEGLTPQDRVIINGLMMARRGSKVEVVEPQASDSKEPKAQ